MPQIDAPSWAEIAPPTPKESEALLDKIIARVTNLLRRSGRLDDAIDDHPEPHLLHARRSPSGRP